MKRTLADNGFVWWIGVVENRHDPARLGRCQVRIFGYHSDNLEELPSADLPWAMIMTPPTSAGVSGIGVSPTGLVEGSWVIGFFLDGDHAQEPLIMGSLPGYSDSFSTGGAFQDPNGVYPRDTGSDTHSRARGVDPYAGQTYNDTTVNVNSDIVDIIAGFEGFRANAWWDYQQYSIGYGTKARSKDEVITKEEGRKRLIDEVKNFASQVNGYDRQYKYNWTQKQKDALTSFAYNLGGGAIKTLTDNGKRTNREISQAIPLYCRAGGEVLEGLQKRRSAEQRIFLQGTPADALDAAVGTVKPQKVSTSSTSSQSSSSGKVLEGASSGWTRMEINGRIYDVGNDYVRAGSQYATFSGDTARAYVKSQGWVMPTAALCRAIAGKAKLIKMPLQAQWDKNSKFYPRGDAAYHTQQIFQITGGYPSGLVAGHKKDVVDGDGYSTCLWGGYKDGGGWWQGGGCPHDGQHEDYSQGLRPIKLAT